MLTRSVCIRFCANDMKRISRNVVGTDSCHLQAGAQNQNRIDRNIETTRRSEKVLRIRWQRLDEVLGTNIWTIRRDAETAGRGQRVFRCPALIRSPRPVFAQSRNAFHETRVSRNVGSSETRNFLLNFNIVISYCCVVGVKRFPRKTQSSGILSASVGKMRFPRTYNNNITIYRTTNTHTRTYTHIMTA